MGQLEWHHDKKKFLLKASYARENSGSHMVIKCSFKGCVNNLLPDSMLGGYVANLKPKILREESNETFDL